MSDDEKDPEELLAQSKEQKRHTTEPSTSESSSSDERTLADAIEDAYAAIEAGEASENSTIRDENLAALLRGLEDVDQLDDVMAAACEDLGRDMNEASVSRSQTLGLLARVGLQAVQPELMETTVSARQSYQASQMDEF